MKMIYPKARTGLSDGLLQQFIVLRAIALLAIELVFCFFAFTLPYKIGAQTTHDPDKDVCQDNLRRIHTAIQAYRKDHKDPGVQWIGKPAPNAVMPLHSGDSIDLASYKTNHVLLLHFWATWCPPCKRSMILMSDISNQFQSKGVVTIGINIRENKELVKAFLQREGISIQVAMDATGVTAQAFGVENIPTFVVVDRHGIIQGYYVGYTGSLAEQIAIQLNSLCGGLKSAEFLQTSRLKIPIRDVQASAQLVDLTRHFNATLTHSWQSTNSGDDLVNLPRGIQNFESLSFDIRGIVQLSGKSLTHSSDRSYPEQIGRIRIQQKAKKIHFLHAVGGVELEEKKVGQIVLNYADGEKREVPILYGSDVRDWLVNADPKNDLADARIAWRGKTSSGKLIRLFMRTWENPRPEVEISHLSYISEMGFCAPFLVGITLEP